MQSLIRKYVINVEDNCNSHDFEQFFLFWIWIFLATNKLLDD